MLKMVFLFFRPLTEWSLLIYYSRLGFLTTWWLASKPEVFKESAETDIPLKV